MTITPPVTSGSLTRQSATASHLEVGVTVCFSGDLKTRDSHKSGNLGIPGHNVWAGTPDTSADGIEEDTGNMCLFTSGFVLLIFQVPSIFP